MAFLVVLVVLLALEAPLVQAAPSALAPQLVPLSLLSPVGPVPPEDQAVHLFQADQQYLALL